MYNAMQCAGAVLSVSVRWAAVVDCRCRLAGCWAGWCDNDDQRTIVQ